MVVVAGPFFTFSTTFDYFRNNGSNIYVCSLDASKAFDRVNHFALFAAMLRRDMPKSKSLGIKFKLGNYLLTDLSSRVRKFQSAVCAVL